MNKLIKEKIKKLKPSATIALNEKSKQLISEGNTHSCIYKERIKMACNSIETMLKTAACSTIL